MGRRDFQSTVADALPRIIQEQAKSGIGSIKFTQKDKKTIGKVYLRGGAIYALELSTYAPNIVNRIATNEFISIDARDDVLKKFENDPSNFAVISYVLTRQLFPEKPLMGYIKDYFLDAFDELYTWEEVNAEWRTHDEPSIPTIPNISPTDLIEKTRRRREYLDTQAAQVWNSATKAMDELGFRKNYEFDNQDYTTAVLLSIADGAWTIGSASDYLGLSHFNTKKLIFELWQQGIVDILHPKGLVITNRTPEDIQENTRPKGVDSVRHESELEAMPEEVTVSEIVTEEVPEEIFEQQNAATEDEADSVDELTQEEEEYPMSEINLPTPFSVPASPNAGPIVDPAENEAPRQAAPFARTAPAPVVTSAPTAPSFSHSEAPRSSRLTQLAQQLKQELANLDDSINAKLVEKNDSESQVASLEATKSDFIQKANALDPQIQNAKQNANRTADELNKLRSERAEITSLLQG